MSVIKHYTDKLAINRLLKALNTVVAGKRVAITGPGKSIIGANRGNLIESYDVVVRLNHQWPIEEKLRVDLGKRMDILFHCANGDYPMAHLFVEDLTKTKLVLCEENPRKHSAAKQLFKECRKRKIKFSSTSAAMQILRGEVETFPNTGTFALWLLLQTKLSELFVTGISFFSEPYYQGYLGHGADPSFWKDQSPPEQIWLHEMAKQRAFAKRFLGDTRFHPDAILKEALVSA
jgi:hypothetical protein